ncbi:DNA adenine methylase [Microtetraspora malaysiensis]|uniref:DNA adenine methylase n=1 Tax=Microtetraspora malaysiensis TaxID=161358 RepID=UPI003D8DB4AE
MLPPIIYYGGKAKIADQIAAMLPVHTHYIEPFCGSMAVLLAKQPAKLETVDDLDRDLMTFWKVLRNRPAELVRLCALTPHSRAEHEAASAKIASQDDDWEPGGRRHLDDLHDSRSLPGPRSGHFTV